MEDLTKSTGNFSFVEKIIKERGTNYVVVGIISFCIFILLTYFCKKTGIHGYLGEQSKNIFNLIILATSIKFVWGSSKIVIEPQYRAQLLFLGTQTGIWIEEGVYFVFFQHFGLFSVYAEKVQHEEKKDVIVEKFLSQDKEGKKIFIEMNADYSIGDKKEDAEKYQKVDEKTMKSNLRRLLQRTAIKVFGKKDYWTEIIGKENHTYIETDEFLKEELNKYGIVFNSIVVEVVSGNKDQDDFNNQVKLMIEKYKENIGKEELSPEELETATKMAMISLGRTKSYDVKGNVSSRLFLDDDNHNNSKY